MIDKITRMLCGLINIVEKRGFAGFVKEADSELSSWWKDHQKKDAKRIAEEKRVAAYKLKRKVALSKLTKEERHLLDL